MRVVTASCKLLNQVVRTELLVRGETAILAAPLRKVRFKR